MLILNCSRSELSRSLFVSTEMTKSASICSANAAATKRRRLQDQKVESLAAFVLIIRI